ncbi:BatD family protein [candidate division KSB1 bacterium]|nr:BatD family protein [candidate division KSB1 bacterium]
MIENFKFIVSNFKLPRPWAALICFVLVFPIIGGAQDVSIKAFVSKNKINSEERLQYTVEVSGKSAVLPDIMFPELKDFYILSGPNQSTNIQFVNGTMASSKTLSFILKPRIVGKLTIGKATLEGNGPVLETKPIVITVTKADPASQKKQPPKSTQNKNQIASDNIFLRSHVLKKKESFHLRNLIQMGKSVGMQTMRMSLDPLLEQGIISSTVYNKILENYMI